MSTPNFSIIIPVYNAQATLPAAIASVQQQTDTDWELVLVDDGSSDRSLSIMLAAANDDPRIRAVSQPNKGPSAARNLGADVARGIWLAFLDADDTWSVHKLATHRQFHCTNPNLNASFAQVEFRDPASRFPVKTPTVSSVPQGRLTLAQVVAENPVCTTSNFVIRRSAFAAMDGFCEDWVHAEDQEFVTRALDAGYRIAGIDQVLVQYSMTESGLSADLEAMLAGWRALADRYSDSIDLAAAEAVYCRYLARRALRTGAKASLAITFMRAGMRLNSDAFLADRHRGLMTIIGSLAALAMPRPMRRRIFA